MSLHSKMTLSQDCNRLRVSLAHTKILFALLFWTRHPDPARSLSPPLLSCFEPLVKVRHQTPSGCCVSFRNFVGCLASECHFWRFIWAARRIQIDIPHLCFVDHLQRETWPLRCAAVFRLQCLGTPSRGAKYESQYPFLFVYTLDVWNQVWWLLRSAGCLDHWRNDSLQLGTNGPPILTASRFRTSSICKRTQSQRCTIRDRDSDIELTNRNMHAHTNGTSPRGISASVLMLIQ